MTAQQELLAAVRADPSCVTEHAEVLEDIQGMTETRVVQILVKPGLFPGKAGFLNGAERQLVIGCEAFRDQEPRCQLRVSMESEPLAGASERSEYHHVENVDGFVQTGGSFLQSDDRHHI
ncbi:predicted protein [Histoplasma capsulatum H143]|uniref:Uncharacterized protein n=1 Tax=Ajellomyces capsulatus (strain H143) TaxID=544712 RepID=C6HGM9_AJECH|nr:predicted protein [Histoplasma capsulatum H143]